MCNFIVCKTPAKRIYLRHSFQHWPVHQEPIEASPLSTSFNRNHWRVSAFLLQTRLNKTWIRLNSWNISIKARKDLISSHLLVGFLTTVNCSPLALPLLSRPQQKAPVVHFGNNAVFKDVTCLHLFANMNTCSDFLKSTGLKETNGKLRG